jgi:uncharacterized Zn-binding protein involved in type VI secretion
MSNAARVTDAVSHGGTVATGSADVTTEGKPTARYGDMVVCALHGTAVVERGSSTVSVNGRAFARAGDPCLCAGGGSAGPGAQDRILFLLNTHGMTLEQILAVQNGTGLHAELVASDDNKDGLLDTLDFRGRVATVDLGPDGEAVWRNTDGANLTMDVGRVDASARFAFADPAGDGGLGYSAMAKGEASAFTTTATARYGPAAVRGRGSLFRASGKAELLVGDDGRRVGAAGALGGSAAVVEGEAEGAFDATVGDLLSVGPLAPVMALGTNAISSLSPTAAKVLSTPIRIEAAVSGSAVSIGASASGEAYYDRETGQAVLGVGGELAALLGLGVDLRVLIGEDQTASDSGAGSSSNGGGGPNLIVGCAGTVTVGG